jgi:hypothetical protein
MGNGIAGIGRRASRDRLQASIHLLEGEEALSLGKLEEGVHLSGRGLGEWTQNISDPGGRMVEALANGGAVGVGAMAAKAGENPFIHLVLPEIT